MQQPQHGALTWRKFAFFTEAATPNPGGEAPAPAGQLASATHPNRDRAYAAHQGAIRLASLASAAQLQQAVAFDNAVYALATTPTLLLAVGSDDGNAAHAALRLWDADRASSGQLAAHQAQRSIKLFASRAHEGAVVCMSACDDAVAGHHLVAVGTASHHVVLLRGDLLRNRFSRAVVALPEPPTCVRVRASPDGAAYAATARRVAAVALGPPQASLPSEPHAVTLDEHGAEPNCLAVEPNTPHECALARPEGVFFYALDGRGPCLAAEGTKHLLSRRGSLALVVGDAPAPVGGAHPAASAASPHGGGGGGGGAPPERQQVTIFDLSAKLIAHQSLTSGPVRSVHQTRAGWLVTTDSAATLLHERPLHEKLALLERKNMHAVGLQLATAAHTSASDLANFRWRWADHLYGKQDYGGAMEQYVGTVGHLEPSYVIRRYLDSSRTRHLATYLEALHDASLAAPDHTTLLLNCYAKLRDLDKLDAFVAEPPDLAASALPPEERQEIYRARFDVGTAVRVCRAAGYFEHAARVAGLAGAAGWKLEVLLDDLNAYDDALAYLQSLPRSAAQSALMAHGKALVSARPDATCALLERLCGAELGAAAEGGPWASAELPGDGDAAPGLGSGAATDDDAVVYAEPAAFLPILVDAPAALARLCAALLRPREDGGAPPDEALLRHTLLELLLGPASDVAFDAARLRLGHASGDALALALTLLREGWPQGESPRFDAPRAVTLCRLRGFRDGALFLYERLGLLREALELHVEAGDADALVASVERLARLGTGALQLWEEVLEHLARMAGQPDRREAVEQAVHEVLARVERAELLPPLVVLQALSRGAAAAGCEAPGDGGGGLTLDVVREYACRALEREAQLTSDDEAAAARLLEEAESARKELESLRTEPRVFQAARCSLTGQPLELPSVHFLCGHSFNARSLGDGEAECPLCAPASSAAREARASLAADAPGRADKFFQQLQSAGDGFAVVAEHFGRALL